MNLATTPPMGWNSWNAGLDSNDYPDFKLLTEQSLLDQAKAMVDLGFLAAGYEYFVLDDGYQNARRDHLGRLQGHALRFRSGIPALAENVRELGLKFGIYSVPGTLTCAQQYNDYVADGLGSLGYETVDADAFAEWGVEYLKYDWCRAHLNDGLLARETFKKMADALRATGKPIVYSISEYGLFEPHLWAPEFSNLWRTTDDLFAHWDSILRTLDLQQNLSPYSGPGHWNDPDMLQVGNHGLSMGENRAHFYLWAVLNAPLMVGTNLLRISEEVRSLLTNSNVVAVDQDWSGEQGKRIWREGDRDVWAKRMSDGSTAAVLLNRGDSIQNFELNELVLKRSFEAVRDVPTGEVVEIKLGGKIEVPARDALLLNFS